MNEIRSIKLNTRDGAVDIVYETAARETRRLASFELPSSAFTEAVGWVALETQKMLSGGPLSLVAIVYKHEIGKVGFRMVFELDARGHVCRLSPPRYEYVIDDHGELKSGVLPKSLAEATIALEEAAQAYIDGERAQKVFDFAGEAAVGG